MELYKTELSIFHKMRNVTGILLLVISIVIGINIPRNPCPKVFNYYRDPTTGVIFGEADIAYDNSTTIDLQVNVTLPGKFINSEYKDMDLQMLTTIDEFKEYPSIITFGIYFHSKDLIPKIKSILYNGVTCCKGPGETDRRQVSFFGKKQTFRISRRPVLPLNNRIEVENENLPMRQDIYVPSVYSFINYLFNSQIDTALNENVKCGIINDKPSESEPKYPWLAAVMFQKDEGFGYKCSGSIISDTYVVTAGNCLDLNIHYDDILLVMGVKSIKNFDKAVLRKVEGVIIFPEFVPNSQTGRGDIALLKMDRPVLFSNSLSRICTWNENPESINWGNAKTDLFPWTHKEGVTGSYEQEPGQPEWINRAMQLTILPFQCKENSASEPTRTFCTENGNSNSSFSSGSIGAGFFFVLQGVAYLRGVLSSTSITNFYNGEYRSYAEYCDVAKYQEWIKNITG